jgi:hypothetical protein
MGTMKRFIKTLKNAIRNYFWKRTLIDLIKYHFDEINKIAREITGTTASSIKLKDLQERNKVIRQAIMFTAFHEQEMKKVWTTEMNQKWEKMFKDFSTNFSDDGKKYQENNFLGYHAQKQKESVKGLWDTYICTYSDFNGAQRISALYKFFEALRYDMFMKLEYADDFFIECNFYQLHMIAEVLHTCEIAMNKELCKLRKDQKQISMK